MIVIDTSAMLAAASASSCRIRAFACCSHSESVAGVSSMMSLALGAGGSLEEAVRLANQAAGIVVGKLGTAVVTADELFA